MNELCPSMRIIPMTKDEFMGKNKKMTIYYSISTTPIGRILIASTHKGICFMMPAQQSLLPVETLKRHFPHAAFRCQKVNMHKQVIFILKQRYDKVKSLDLNLYGTDFQIAVWSDLLQVPVGKVTTYLTIAKHIGNPKAARAVGQAVGNNPVAYLIPCHRVICSNGKLGGFRWGVALKIKFLNKEACATQYFEGTANWEPTLL